MPGEDKPREKQGGQPSFLGRKGLDVKPFEVKFEGTLQELQEEIVQATNAAAQKRAGRTPATAAARSQILQAAYTNTVLANADKLIKIGFSLRFTLNFSLRF